MKYSIIHISDIHKSDDVDYESLYQSLKRDLDAYTSHEGIVNPHCSYPLCNSLISNIRIF